MYERNAIVLDRYFNKIFEFNKNDNLKSNYSNYCKLMEQLKIYNDAILAEKQATNEFENISKEIDKVQNYGEKLYNKNAKLEYSRYIVFKNIEEKSEEIEKCLEKIEIDIEKNENSLKELDKEFLNVSNDYKIKKSTLLKCKSENEKAKAEYEETLRKTTNTFQNISDETLTFSKEFISLDNKDGKKELNLLLNENGKNEKNPFDIDVISNAVDISFEIYKKEIQIYLSAYEKTDKFLREIQENDVKLDKHKKFLNDNKAKLDFLFAEKDYIVGFLDNERIAAIYDKKLHRKLMIEACRNFSSDLEYINNLYEIILKEAISRSSKRLYKENYNKNYLADIEKESEKVQEETNKLKANAVAVMNLNYWRIEGINRIQDVFDTDVMKIYGKDVNEILDIKSVEEAEVVENIQICKDSEKPNRESQKKKRTIKNIAKKNDILNMINSDENKAKIEESKEFSKENDVDDMDDMIANYVFNKKDKKEFHTDEFSDENTSSDLNDNIFEKISELDEPENIPANYQEESILDFYFKNNNVGKSNLKVESNQKNKKNGIFQKLIGVNSKNKQEV